MFSKDVNNIVRNYMNIYEILDLNMEKKEVLSFVGGGGKTTSIFLLGKELKKLNKRVLITTTTAMFSPNREDYDYFLLKEVKNNFFPHKGTITIYGENIKNGKLIGSEVSKVDNIIKRDLFDFILIEADGSKGRSIKAPEVYEPVISKLTTKTIGIIGLEALGEKISEETVHRPEIFTKVIGKDLYNIINENDVVKLVLHKNGLFKDAQGEKVLILNKAINQERINKGCKVKEMLLNTKLNKILVADIKEKKFY